MTVRSRLCAFPITPADAGRHVDAVSLRRLVAYPVRAQVSSIDLFGNASLHMYLMCYERRRTLDTTPNETGGRTPVVVRILALKTDEAIKPAQVAKAVGVAYPVKRRIGETCRSSNMNFCRPAEVPGPAGG